MCAIYILIAGSYTPFLSIVLHHESMWSGKLLAFIWMCGISGIGVEAFFPLWKHKPLFSLAMYLGESSSSRIYFIRENSLGAIFARSLETIVTLMNNSHSIIFYPGMGWSCMVCMKDLVASLPTKGLYLLVAGGVAYTSGGECTSFFFIRRK